MSGNATGGIGGSTISINSRPDRSASVAASGSASEDDATGASTASLCRVLLCRVSLCRVAGSSAGAEQPEASTTRARTKPLRRMANMVAGLGATARSRMSANAQVVTGGSA